MKGKIILLVSFCALVAVGFVIYKKKAGAAYAIDPAFHHTPEGVNAKIQEQRTLLDEAVKRKDLEFVHNQMYYVQTLADALSSKLAGEKKQRVDEILRELKRTAEEIDNWAGRGNQAATEAGFQKLSATVKELDGQFRVEPKGKPAKP
jgi:hypothetical protein